MAERTADIERGRDAARRESWAEAYEELASADPSEVSRAFSESGEAGVSRLDGLQPPGVRGKLGHVTGERDDETCATVLAVLHERGTAVQLRELLHE